MSVKFDSKKNSVVQDYDWLAKIIILGNSGVGKTSIILKFTDNKFCNSYTATLGVDFKSKTL